MVPEPPSFAFGLKYFVEEAVNSFSTESSPHGDEVLTQLVEAGYDVTYGRRLYMEQGETVITDDPSEIDERDYYTLAYAVKQNLEIEPATAKFDASETEESEGEA